MYSSMGVPVCQKSRFLYVQWFNFTVRFIFRSVKEQSEKNSLEKYIFFKSSSHKLFGGFWSLFCENFTSTKLDVTTCQVDQ